MLRAAGAGYDVVRLGHWYHASGYPFSIVSYQCGDFPWRALLVSRPYRIKCHTIIAETQYPTRPISTARVKLSLRTGTDLSVGLNNTVS